jgi:hypothetical protein
MSTPQLPKIRTILFALGGYYIFLACIIMFVSAMVAILNGVSHATDFETLNLKADEIMGTGNAYLNGVIGLGAAYLVFAWQFEKLKPIGQVINIILGLILIFLSFYIAGGLMDMNDAISSIARYRGTMRELSHYLNMAGVAVTMVFLISPVIILTWLFHKENQAVKENSPGT